VVRDQVQMKQKRDEEKKKNKIRKRANPYGTKGVGEECSFPQGQSTRQSN